MRLASADDLWFSKRWTSDLAFLSHQQQSTSHRLLASLVFHSTVPVCSENIPDERDLLTILSDLFLPSPSSTHDCLQLAPTPIALREPNLT